MASRSSSISTLLPWASTLYKQRVSLTTMAEYSCLSRFTVDLYRAMVEAFKKQVGNMSVAYTAYEDAADIIQQCYENPDTTTKVSLEALHVECLAQLDRYAALIAEYKTTIEGVDVDAVTNIVAMSPLGEGKAVDEIKEVVEEDVRSFLQYLNFEASPEEIKEMRQEVDHQVRVAIALLEEGWAVDE
jgi:hypothetical protein